MAGVARGRHRLELAAGCAFVAGVAVDRGMRAGERETIIVLLDLLCRNLPSPHSVALLAISSQLAAVDVRMAILATLTDVGKYGLHVALRAGDGLMHSPQWIPRLIVIEFRHGANRLPGACRVAILARQVEIPVRAVRALVGLCKRGSATSCDKKQQN